MLASKGENMEEWMGCLRIKANKSGYKEKNRRLKEQFLNDINDDMVTKIIRELTTIKKTDEMTSEQVLCWAKRVEAHKM